MPNVYLRTKVFIDSNGSGTPKRFFGTTRYVGHKGKTHYFHVQYDDGDSATMKLAALKRLMGSVGAADASMSGQVASPPMATPSAPAQPNPTAVPQPQSHRVSQNSNTQQSAALLIRSSARTRARSTASCLSVLPMTAPIDGRHLHDYEDGAAAVYHALQHDMPGRHDGCDMQSLTACVMSAVLPESVKCDFSRATASYQLAPLLSVVDFSECVDVFDPWSRTGKIFSVFRQYWSAVAPHRSLSSPLEPLTPQRYADARSAEE
jgi:hypothetical protein